MKAKSISRRKYLKMGALGVGSTLLMPQLGFSASNRPTPMDRYGNFIYSPFFKEYVPDRWLETEALSAKLNANENPHGPSPKALEALASNLGTSNRYAWKNLFKLIEMIADYEGVKPENVLMGPGSSDILEKTAMILFKDGTGNVVSADPAYMSLVRVAEASGGTWKSVPLKDWAHDLDAMENAIDAETKLVYICNPNNPTGTITDSKKLIDFCSRVSDKVPVFVDEAYLDFLEDGHKESMVSLINKGKDIIVARTFSKIHGMAGLRVGYAIAQESRLEQFRSITRGGMGISHPSVYAAIASMEDTAFLEKSRALNTDAREYTFNTLKSMGHDPVPSYTSFMIFPIEMEGKSFLNKMNDLKVAVRSFQFMDKTWCRVSMGTMDEMKLFTSTLSKVLV